MKNHSMEGYQPEILQIIGVSMIEALMLNKKHENVTLLFTDEHNKYCRSMVGRFISWNSKISQYPLFSTEKSGQ